MKGNYTEMHTFENTLYHDNWLEFVPKSERLYRMGTWGETRNGKYVIYDGATNFIGYITPNGEFEYANENHDEYDETFMITAKTAIGL